MIFRRKKSLNKLYILNTDIFDDPGAFEAAYNEMDEPRKKKIDAYRFQKDKKLSLGAGFLLKRGLSEIGIEDYEIGYGDRQKPFLVGHEDVFFNISHSGTMAVLALSDREVGVDIEAEKEFKDTLVDYVFSAGDKALAKELETTLGFSANKAYTRLWTVKESIMKYSGIGIALTPKGIELSQKSVGKGTGVEIKAASKDIDLEGLNLISFDMDGYQLTVCSEYETFELTDFQGT